MSCALLGADELMHHAEQRLGIKAGGTTPDGLFTLEHAECQAACTEAPCLQVNYRYRYRVTTEPARRAARRPRRAARSTTRSRRTARVARVRQHIPADRGVGAVASPRTSPTPPAWIPPAEPRRRRRDHGTTLPARRRASSPATGREIVTSRFQLRRLATRSTRYLATGGYEGLQGRAGRARRRHVHEEVRLGDRARSRRRRLPGRREVGPHPAGRVAALPRRQRRRERARHLQGPPADGARSAPADRGLPDRLLRRRAVAVLPLHPRRDGAGPGARRHGAQRGLRRRLRRQEHPRHRLLRRHRAARGAPAPTSSARRRR